MKKAVGIVPLILFLTLLTACNSFDATPGDTAQTFKPLYGDSNRNEMWRVDANPYLGGKVFVNYGMSSWGGPYGCLEILGFSRSGDLPLTFPTSPDHPTLGCPVSSDSHHNIYVSYDSYEAAGSYIVKFNTAGERLWSRYTFPHDYVGGVRLTVADDRLYHSGAAGTVSWDRTRAFVSAFNLDGTTIWTRIIDTSGNDDAHGVAVDTAGSVYVAGSTTGSLAIHNPGDRDLFVRAYHRDGRLRWTKQFYYPGANALVPSDVSLTGKSVYVGGTLSRPDGSSDGFLYKFDVSGQLLWQRFVDAATTDHIYGVASDVEGSAYVIGMSRGSPHVDLTPIFVKKYRSDGALMWERRYHGTKGWDIDVMSPSEIYIVGQTDRDLGAGYHGNLDGFLRRLNSTGIVVWTR